MGNENDNLVKKIPTEKILSEFKLLLPVFNTMYD